MTSEQFFQLVDHGGFEPDDRVELLARHAHVDLVQRGARLSLVALPGVSIAVDDVLPASRA